MSMTVIFEVDVVVANLWAAGLAKISIRDLNSLCDQLSVISNDFYIDRSDPREIAESCPELFSYISTDENHTFVRGCWANPENYIRIWLGSNHRLDRVIREKLIEASLKALPEMIDHLAWVFTPEYVETVFNWRIPEEHRIDFVRICQEFAKNILANSNEPETI